MAVRVGDLDLDDVDRLIEAIQPHVDDPEYDLLFCWLDYQRRLALRRAA